MEENNILLEEYDKGNSYNQDYNYTQSEQEYNAYTDEFIPKVEPEFEDSNIIKWVILTAFVYSFSYIVGQIINF